MLKNLLLVGFGGGLGSMLRYGTGLLIHTKLFPYATLAVNITGSFLIGLIYASYGKTGNLSPATLLFLATGICGGFTTFSAFSYENILLMRNGQYLLSIIYITGSVFLGLLATLLGYTIGK